MRYVKCDRCGTPFNREVVSNCPICVLGEAEPRRRKGRGKAARGTLKAVSILELVMKHKPQVVVRMLKGKVGRSTVYKIIRESIADAELLHDLGEALETAEREGEKLSTPILIWLPPEIGKVVYKIERDFKRLGKLLSEIAEEICHLVEEEKRQGSLTLSKSQRLLPRRWEMD